MSTPKNHGTSWTPKQVQQLRTEAEQNTPTRIHGLHQGRTENAIYAKAGELGLSLKPTNQSPYGTGGKRKG